MHHDPRDWHPADIRAALNKRGHTFKSLSLANGYRSPDACGQALHRPYPKVERLIANAIGVAPEIIWPSRYVVNVSTEYNARPARGAVNGRAAG